MTRSFGGRSAQSLSLLLPLLPPSLPPVQWISSFDVDFRNKEDKMRAVEFERPSSMFRRQTGVSIIWYVDTNPVCTETTVQTQCATSRAEQNGRRIH